MTMTRATRSLAIGLGLVAMALAGCGGGSSSTGPTGSGGGGAASATVQGQIFTTRSAAGESIVVVALRTALGIGLAEAATPLAGVTVELRDATNALVATTTTNADGNFTFFNVAPGTYTVTVMGFTVASPPTVTVGAGDTGVVTGTVTGDSVAMTATVVAENFDNPLQNDAQLGHAINIDRASATCDLDDVLDRREQGRGWGVIAQECNTHPGVIGLGHSNLSDEELAATREQQRAKGRGGKGPKGPKKA